MNFILVGVLGIVIMATIAVYIELTPRKAPELTDVYWGPGEVPEKLDESIRPFRVVFNKEVVNNLKDRLRHTRKLRPPLENVGSTYGMNSNFLPIIIDYWLNKYDFAKRENHLNQYNHFITNIQGLDIHFMHVRPKPAADKRVLPLLFLHGWPGSFVEFYKVIPLLTTPRPEHDFVFEVVVASLPGFGYSDGAARAGLGPPEMALILKNLMLRIGIDKFYTQSGDWGSFIASDMAAIFPENVLGMHSNMCIVVRPWVLLKTILYSFFPSLIIPQEHQHLMYPLLRHWTFWMQESGYFHIQATKPDTIGVALSDSPAGLAAYILEKISTGTKRENKYRDDAGLFQSFQIDDLIDNLMIYWSTNSVTTAARLYAEAFTRKQRRYKMQAVPITVPTACAQFPREIFYQPEDFLKERYKNLIRTTIMPRGGHFAAMEEPQLLADDIWTSIDQMEILHAIDKGKAEERRKKEQKSSESL